MRGVTRRSGWGYVLMVVLLAVGAQSVHGWAGGSRR